MRPVAPRLPGVEERQYSGEGDDAKWRAITFGDTVSEEGSRVVITRWQPNDEERAMIFGGADIYLYITGGLPPHKVVILYGEAPKEKPRA